MANQLIDAITAGVQLGKPMVWLDAEDYGSRVLLNDKPFPWTSPTEFVSSYGQLQNLLKSDVAPVHVGRFLQAWLVNNSTALAEMRGKKRVRFAIKRLLGMEGQRQQIREIVSALCESLSQPLVLVMPPNGDMINWANNAANGAEFVELTEIDVDTVSVYLADYMRAFSGLDVAGVLVQLPAGTAVTPEFLELYSPIINVARHYHWAVGVQVSGAPVIEDPDDLLQFVIAEQTQCRPTGIDSGAALWQGEAGPVTPPDFVYSQVPADIEPERLLDRLAEIFSK